MTSRPQYPMDSGLSRVRPAGRRPAGRRPAGRRPADGEGTDPGDGTPPAPVPADRDEMRRATVAYLGVPFTLCLVPLAVYLTSTGTRRFARAHAAVALSLSLATILYMFSILIVGGVLALDSALVGTLAADAVAGAAVGRRAGRGDPRGWGGQPR